MMISDVWSGPTVGGGLGPWSVVYAPSWWSRPVIGGLGPQVGGLGPRLVV